MPAIQPQTDLRSTEEGALELPGEQGIWEQHQTLRARLSEVSQLARQLKDGGGVALALRAAVDALAREYGAHVASTSAGRPTLERVQHSRITRIEEVLKACREQRPPPALSRLTLGLVRELLDDMFIEEATFLGPR